MLVKILIGKSLLGIAAAVGLAVVVGCGDGGGETEVGSREWLRRQIEIEGPTRSGDGPGAGANVSGAAATRITATGGGGTGEYVPQTVGPGEFPTKLYDGPPPTKFRESPEMAELVRQGKLPPLEERLPVPEDVRVVSLPQEIGLYGGTRRLTGTYPALIHSESTDACLIHDYDRATRVPHFCKSVEISEDGKTYIVTLRRGVKWSDGEPVDMEDVRFAWEDLNFNTEFHRHTPPDYRDAVTGNDARFAIQDDWTFTITYDTPNYTLAEGKILGTTDCRSWCWYAPKHHLKIYHPRYAEPKFLKAEIARTFKGDWIKLFRYLDSHREFSHPFTGPYYNPPNGTLWGYGTDYPWSRGYAKLIRNPYYFSVDAEGNQLPYIDAVEYPSVISRETAIFRNMAGDADGPSRSGFKLTELPMYHYNMEKGDFSIYSAPSNSGLDAGFTLNQDFKLDPELGKLMRTKDFRLALSYAMDRETINNVMFLGLGTPQNWAPHPSTLFYPGREWATYEIAHDVDKAKELMAKMGYKDTDGDGYYNRLDGRGNLTLYLEGGASVGIANLMTGSEQINVSILIQKQWKKLGVKLAYRLGTFAEEAYEEGRQYMLLGQDSYSHEPWGPPWTHLTPQYEGRSPGPEIARYFFTNGKEGMKPSGPDPKWTDIYNNMSPQGESYPSDISRCKTEGGGEVGCLMQLQNLIVQGRGLPRLSPARIEIGKEIFRIHAREKYVINTVGFSGCCGGVGIVRNNVRNFSYQGTAGGGGEIAGGGSELFFFEDGIDNVNHPGNRSSRYKSWSFALNP